MSNKTHPLVSVLVPVYGVEKYIERFVRSIFEQTYENLEIIFVNDCTPDASIDVLRRVLKEYPSRISQTRIIDHNVNKGLAAARKTALMASTGYYIQNYDSDDYVEKDMIEKMVQSAQDADITICDYSIIYDNGISKKINVNPPIDNIVCIQKLLSGDVHASVCNKLIRRSLYINNNIFPIEGLNMCEDLSVMFRLMYYAEKVAYIPKSLYNYVQGRAGSYTSSTMNLAQQKDAIALINLFEDFFRGKNVTSEIYKEIRYYKAGTLCKIALFGDIAYYRQTKDTFKDVRFIDLLTQPTVGIRRKVCGILLYCRCMVVLNFIRKIRN